MKKHVRINKSKSLFNFFKKHSRKKKNDIIKKIDEKTKKMDDTLELNEPFSKDYEITSKEHTLLNLMYREDVDSDFVKDKLRTTDKELMYIVENLLDKGLVKRSSNDEIELTSEAVYYITSDDIDLS